MLKPNILVTLCVLFSSYLSFAQLDDPCELAIPETSDVYGCGSDSYVLTATGDETLTWFNFINGEPIGNGTNHETPVLDQTTDYFVASVGSYNANWSFDSGLQGWTQPGGCLGINQAWQNVDDGGALGLFAEDFSTNSTQLLLSPQLDASQAVSVDFTLNHRYNTETCCDHGYVAYRIDGGPWIQFIFETNPYNVFDFMYNDPIFGACGNSPDMSMFAGDSGGYVESIGSAPVPVGSSTIQFAFLFTSDASFGDEGWYIDNALATVNCQSDFAHATVNILPLISAPITSDGSTCSGDAAELTATSTSDSGSPEFFWYDDLNAPHPIESGSTYDAFVDETTTYYAQEGAEGGGLQYVEGFDNGLNGWTASATCGLTQNWEQVTDQGREVLKANNPSGGNTSMLLTSPNIGVGNFETVYLGFKHRFNTETCCDHGYVVYRLDAGDWQMFDPAVNPYPIYDFMYNDPIFGGCGFSPDTTVFSGDSNGYLTSAGLIDVDEATTLQVGFLFTSDASFSDEGWFLDEVTLISQEFCPSALIPAVAYFTEQPSAPLAEDVVYCGEGLETISAMSTSGSTNPALAWYDQQVGGNVLAVGSSFQMAPGTDQTIYVSELANGDLDWVFSSDFDGWTTESHCGLPGEWIWIDDGGEGALFAQQTGSGNSSMSLLSPPINTGLSNQVNLSFEHRFNTETCCDHGYVVYRIDGGEWNVFVPTTNAYNIFDFQYNDHYLADCGFSPDMDLFAGDSGGDMTSSGSIDMSGGTVLEIAFFYSSDASFVDEGWYVKSVSIDGIGLEGDCQSEMTPVMLSAVELTDPDVSGNSICLPGDLFLTATSNSGLDNTSFNWYQNADDDIPLAVGNLTLQNVTQPTTVYVEEVYPMLKHWSFDEDFEGWVANAQCGLIENWLHVDDNGEGALFAGNPSGGNTSMLLQSPEVSLDATAFVRVDFSHRYNTETCCDHGYVVYRLDGGDWEYTAPYFNGYNVYDFMYNDPILGGCGFSPDTNVYAGDSGGYLPSITQINTEGASSIEVGFLFTSDASFNDDGWYINQVEMRYFSAECSIEPMLVEIDYSHSGCTEPTACNYDPTAGCESGSCVYDAVACSNCVDQLGNGVDFMDYYVPGNWSQEFNDGNGSIQHNQGSILITGTNNDGTGNFNVLTQTTITAELTGTYTFFWDYYTFDGAQFDPAYYINGVPIQLTNDLGGFEQSGFVSFAANAGDLIGFGVDATDGCCGQGMLLIEEFTYPVVPCGCMDFAACNYDPFAVEESGNCCYDNCIIFEMTDGFGDGWNGGEYTVREFVTDQVVAAGTLENFSLDTDTWCLNAGCYYLQVTGGVFPSEIGWTLTGSDDGILEGGVTELQYFSVGGVSCYACTDQAACNYSQNAAIEDGSCCYENCVDFEMFDSFGDGWNGATYSIVNVNLGIEVLSGTMTGGSEENELFCLPVGCYEIVVTAGAFPSEISWILNGVDGGPLAGVGPDEQLFSVGGTDCFGCTDFLACNYNPFAAFDDGSCIYGSCDCPGDFNNSGGIDTADLLMLLADYGCPNDCLTDMDGNDMVTTNDLLAFLAVFGTLCP